MSGRVAVIAGGTSPEHEVSLRSAAAVAAALRAGGSDVLELTIGRDGVWRTAEGALGLTPASSVASALVALSGCEAVFPVLHGAMGEDGTLAALLALADLPAVGCGVRAGAIAMDKHATKAVATALGIRTAPGVLVLRGDPVPRVPIPAVVKPTTAGSSVGVALVRRVEQLAAAVERARRVGDAVLIEQYIDGTEVHVGVLEQPDGELLVPPPIEFVVADGAVFDTSSKYDGSTAVRLPAAVAPRTADALSGAAVRLFGALGCAGLARFDFFVAADGSFLLNEVNTMPGMTDHSGFPLMCRAAGLDHAALVDVLVRTAVARHRSVVTA